MTPLINHLNVTTLQPITIGAMTIPAGVSFALNEELARSFSADFLRIDGPGTSDKIHWLNPVIRDTRAAIFAMAGWFIGQKAYAKDYGVGNASNRRGLAYFWNGTAWELPPDLQQVGMQHVDATCDATANENTLFTMSMPPLGANDQILVRAGWTYTNSANNKTERIKAGVSGGIVYSLNVTTSSGDVRDYFLRNRNSNLAQIGGFGGSTVYGTAGSGSPNPGAVDLSAVSTLSITGQKALNTETLTLNFANVFLCGGGTP